MELIRYPYNFKPGSAGSVCAIGCFDGVHLGHQAMLEQLKSHSQQLGLPSVVITFDPHPSEVLAIPRTPSRITTLREKLQIFKQFDIDQIVCLRFNQTLIEQSAEAFVHNILVNDLNIKRAIIDRGFRFGNNREGDFSALEGYGDKFGFNVVQSETLQIEGQLVTSELIRDKLAASDFNAAKQLLGRDFSISGRVSHGAKRGRQLGFHTANINLSKRYTPVNGVFAVKVDGIDNKTYNGVANIGTRPVFDGTTQLLEAHIFNFSRMIYGKHIDVAFFKKLRDEKRFSSIDQLVTQIAEDKQTAINFFEQLDQET